jgi:hypothetical protein
MDPGTVAGLAVGVGIPIVLIYLLFMRARNPKIRGPALTGTAQVLSLETTGGVINNVNYVCRIGLRVEVRGREPYDVTVRRLIPVTAMAAVQPGSIIAVQVDSANPHSVRIDLSQPVQRRPQVGSSGSAEQFAEQVKTALEEKLKQIPGVTVASDDSGSSGSPPTVAALAGAYKQSPGSVPVASAADVLASGQRVRGCLSRSPPP